MSLYPFNSPIAKKLVWWFVAISTTVALFSTGVQLYLDYRHELRSMRSYLDSLETTYLPSIAKNTWLMDDTQINTLLEGITNRDDILYAAITFENEVHWSSGQRTDVDRIRVQLPITYENRNKVELIGSLTVVANLESVYQELTRRAFIVLLSNGVKTFIVAALGLMVVQYLVTSHLQTMAAHVSRISFKRPLPEFRLKRSKSGPDELDAVAAALSTMQARGYRAYRDVLNGERQLRLFLDSTAEGVFGLDGEGSILFANTKFYHLLKLTPADEVINKPYSELVTYSCLDSARTRDPNGLLETVKGGDSFICDDSFITCSDGSGFYGAIRAYPTFSDNHFSGAIVFFSDTSEHRQTLHQMELLKQALDNSPISVLITDSSLTVVYVNPGFEKATGYRLQEIQGRTLDSFSGQDAFKQTYLEAAKQTLEGNSWEGRVKFTTKTGRLRVADVIASPIVNGNGEVTNLVSVSRDVTYEEELQNHLITYQKQKALGRLSASIAHEFGNPLLGIKSLLKDFSKRSLPSTEDHELVKIGVGECERMQSLINDINKLYGDHQQEERFCNIVEIITTVMFFQKKNFEDHNIVTKVTHLRKLPELVAREDQIGQVILNLVINGVEAMKPEGGELSITTDHDQRFISIMIKDAGAGIDPTLNDLIFEPFFSTKPDIEGTGLGLSVSYGIITALGGTLTFESSKGEGTTFTIQLPLSETQGVVPAGELTT